MARVGEIILVFKYVGDDGVDLNKHSFIVVSDEEGEIQGYQYNYIANVMSSIKDKEHKKEKLRFIENMEITKDDRIMTITDNGYDAYIKADKLFFFNSSQINYVTIGRITDEKLDELLERIEELKEMNKIVIVTENLK